MPITKQVTVTHTLMKINVDMAAMSMWCYFERKTDGIVDGGYEVNINGTDLAALFSTQATAAQPLSDEITVAIYNYAVANNLIAGVAT